MRVLVAGVGNELRKDDGIGPAVIRRIAELKLDREYNIHVQNFGQNLYELILMLKDYDALVIVDAIEGDGVPGDIYISEPLRTKEGELGAINLHDADLKKFIELGEALGALPDHTYIVGCHPKDVSYGVGLTPEISEKIDGIAEVVINIVKKLVKSCQ